MRNSDEPHDPQLQKLKQSLLDTTREKFNLRRERYSFHKRLSQKINNNQRNSQDSNKEIDILQASQYLKLLCHQKKYLSTKRAEKINELNESLQIQQEDFKFLFMTATQANYLKLEYPQYYEKLLEQVSKYPKTMFSSIEKDIHRTLLNSHPLQSSLRNVLTAFAIRNPHLLYCQGMNYLVAYFLINSVSEEETFWILVCLVENVLPDDYFKNLSTISIATQIFSDVLPYLFPDMGREMKGIGMDCSLFIVSWFVCLFTKGFINSVSSYLLVKLVLESRKQSFSFALLKLSLGVIAAILGRDQPFTFRAQFTAFRDKFEQSVLEISLLEIKLGIEYVQLNQQNFLKLQKHYMDKRQQRHIQALQRDIRNKRFWLPICNTQFPICLHRIEIQRRIGNVEEVIITKNGHSIDSQYIQNYFDNQLKKELSCNTYESIDDCLLYRQNHICQLDLMNGSQIDLKKTLANKISLRHDESFQLQLERELVENLQESECSIEVRSSYSKADERFKSFSGYFVVDQKFHFGSDEEVQEVQDASFEESGQIVGNIEKQGSTKSLDEPSNLIQQFAKNTNKPNLTKSQKKCKTQEEAFKGSQQEKDQNTPQQLAKNSNLQVQIKNQVAQKRLQQDQKTLSIQQNEKNLFSKEKIWNFIGRTWKKVVRIKEQELKN